MRTREIEKMVLDYYMNYRNEANYTHYYSVANPIRNGEVCFLTYACRLTSWTRQPLIKCVQKCYSNSNIIELRDIYRSSMGGFQVDFSDLTRQCNHYGEKYYTAESLQKCPVGTWDTMKYEGFKTGFLIHAPLLNDLSGTKYEHSGLIASGLHPMRFFECYRISRSVEFLAKNNLLRFIRPAFVKALRDDKRLFNFFRMHLPEIRKKWYGIKEVRTALAHNCSLAEAEERIRASNEFANKQRYLYTNLPKGIDRYELFKWCKKNNVEPNEYRRYATYLNNCGEEILAYGVTYPRDFRAALEAAEARSHREDERRRREELRRRRQQERVARMNTAERKEWDKKENKRIAEAIADMAKRLAQLNGFTGYGYAVVIPKSQRALLKEGNEMKNCIGKMGYGKKIADGESLIFFLRGADGKKNVDVEIAVCKVGKTFKLEVVQCYTACNQVAPEGAKQFARELAEKAKAILSNKKNSRIRKVA